MSGDPFYPDRTGGERRQFLPDGEEDRVTRTKRESDRRKRDEKWQICWCCREQQRACRMAQALAEKLEHTGSDLKKGVASVPQREQLAVRRSRFCQKKKEITRSQSGRKSR